jgi:hypothetical protein
VLFMNPSLAGSARLTWCFEFAFEDVTQNGGPLSLTIEWLPVPTSSCQRMAGLHLTSLHFAQPTELAGVTGGSPTVVA